MCLEQRHAASFPALLLHCTQSLLASGWGGHLFSLFQPASDLCQAASTRGRACWQPRHPSPLPCPAQERHRQLCPLPPVLCFCPHTPRGQATWGPRGSCHPAPGLETSSSSLLKQAVVSGAVGNASAWPGLVAATCLVPLGREQFEGGGGRTRKLLCWSLNLSTAPQL